MDNPKSTANTSPLQAKNSHSIHWHDLAEAVALRLLGEPNHKLSNNKSLRWGNKGSKLLDRATGRWKDFESGKGGGVLELVRSHTGLADKQEIINWLGKEGFIDSRQPTHPTRRKPAIANGPIPEKGVTSNTEHSAKQKKKDAHELWFQSTAIPVDPQHPARRWLARRNLWHPDFSITPALAYLSHHKEGPCIVAMAASLENWISAYPGIPHAEAIQRIFIDATGKKRFVALANDELKKHDKLSLGLTSGKVFCLGNPQAAFVTICEGVADCLALGSRLEGLHICTLGTSGLNATNLKSLTETKGRQIRICADNDTAGKMKAEELRKEFSRRGLMSLVTIPAPYKDFAEQCRTSPWPELEEEDRIFFDERTSILLEAGTPEHEAERLAMIYTMQQKYEAYAQRG